MGRIAFFPSIARDGWLRRLLPDVSAAELPVAGRRFIDYALEIAALYGIDRARVYDSAPGNRLAAMAGDFAPQGLEVEFKPLAGDPPRGLDDVADLVGDGDAVVWGVCLTHWSPDAVRFEPLAEEETADTPPGIYVKSGERWTRAVPGGCAVADAKSWHALGFRVLEHPELYTLPGYSAENGVHIGRSVVTEFGFEAKPPVIIGDNSWLARNVRLEGDVIIGPGCFVGEGTRLKDSVVCRGTYIGRGLDLEGKIVAGRRIIDAETGAFFDTEEPGISGNVGSSRAFLRKVWNFLRGRSCGRRG